MSVVACFPYVHESVVVEGDVEEHTEDDLVVNEAKEQRVEGYSV